MFYREIHPDRNFKSHALVGVFFFSLSIFLGVQTVRYVTQPQVLGLQAQLMDGSSRQTGDGQSGGSGTSGELSIPKVTAEPTQRPPDPTSVPLQPEPTQVTIQPSQAVPVPTETPQQEQVVITNPETEIIIKNEDNTLLIVDAGDNTPIATVPSVPTNPDDSTQIADSVPQIQPDKTNDSIFLPTPMPDTNLAVLPTTSPLVSAQEPVPTQEPKGPVTTIITDVIDTIFGPSDPTVDGPVVIDPVTGNTIPVQELPSSPTGVFSDVVNTIVRPFGFSFGSSRGSESQLAHEVDSRPTFFGFRIGPRDFQPFRGTVPASSVRITYASDGAHSNLDEWLKKYQFQVWALGEEYIAIYRNGITTITPYPIKLGLSKLSFKILSERGEMQVLYYPDTVWSYLSDNHIISDNTHDEPLMLVSENDELTYHIKADSNQFLLAMIPSSVCMEVTVSAQTRAVQDMHTCSAWDKVKDLFSLKL